MKLEEFILQCEKVKNRHNVTMEHLHDKAFKSWIIDYANESPKEPCVAALKELGLTAKDGFFVWSYTGSSSSWLNGGKRNCNEYSSDCKKYFADSLEKTLRKLPVYQGKAWRWEEADDKLQKFNWFNERIGLSVRIPYFLSTSKDNITAKPMLWEIRTISNGYARDISQISNNPYEQEILFIPNAKFKIISVRDDNRTIVMRELPPDTDVEFDLCGAYDHDPNNIDPEMVEPGIFD